MTSDEISRDNKSAHTRDETVSVEIRQSSLFQEDIGFVEKEDCSDRARMST